MAPGFGPRERGALLAGRAAGQVVRGLGRGGGTALPGLIAARLAPGIVESAALRLGHGVVTVTGTNGKTTTAHLLSAVVRGAGLRPLANRSGSNLERGIVSALVDAIGTGGGVRDAERRLGVFEVDEAHWPLLAPRLHPRVALFLNLFRDQLDRYGEVDSIAAAWRAAVGAPGAASTLVLNVDDPSVAQLSEDYARGSRWIRHRGPRRGAPRAGTRDRCPLLSLRLHVRVRRHLHGSRGCLALPRLPAPPAGPVRGRRARPPGRRGDAV
ncbi:MAG: Mur ligase family protein [Dehalococcoidia bacterium]